MSKTLLKIFIVFAAMFSFISCDNFDKESDYTFKYVLDYILKDKDDLEPLKAYFMERIDFETQIKMHGKQSEVITKVANDFHKMCQEKFTNKEVEALLPNDNDGVALNLVMLIGSGYTPVAQIIWLHNSENDSTGDITPSSE